MSSQTQVSSQKQHEFLSAFTSVDSSRVGELHLQAMCYVYVLRLWSLLLKQPPVSSWMRHAHVATINAPWCVT